MEPTATVENSQVGGEVTPGELQDTLPEVEPPAEALGATDERPEPSEAPGNDDPPPDELIEIPMVDCAKCGAKVPINCAQARSATTYWCNSCNSVMKTLRTNLSWPPFCFEGLPEIAKKEFFAHVKSLKEREKDLKYGKIRDVLLKSVCTSRTEELIKQKGGTFWPLSVYEQKLVCYMSIFSE